LKAVRWNSMKTELRDDVVEMDLICVVCPIGCSIKLRAKDGKVEIVGNRCPKGYEYAMDEYRDPKRILTTNVRVLNGDHELLSVKTDSPIPKRLIWEMMRILKNIRIEAPKEVGEIILENVLNTGANIVSTRRIMRRKS